MTRIIHQNLVLIVAAFTKKEKKEKDSEQSYRFMESRNP